MDCTYLFRLRVLLIRHRTLIPAHTYQASRQAYVFDVASQLIVDWLVSGPVAGILVGSVAFGMHLHGFATCVANWKPTQEMASMTVPPMNTKRTRTHNVDSRDLAMAQTDGWLDAPPDITALDMSRTTKGLIPGPTTHAGQHHFRTTLTSATEL